MDALLSEDATLEDNGDDENPIEGSFRYGIKKVSGPRTIVFDVAGVISLKSRLTCADKFVTIAGQTAPGNGIMLRTCPFGMQSDGITRFLRMRLGHKKLINNVIPGGKNSYSYGAEEGTSEETTLGGLDGMGMAGNDHAIMDHCSISWTIDEAFSSRNGKGLTLQHTLIGEALNQAGHPNYSAGDRHGYAATIGGGEMGGQPIIIICWRIAKAATGASRVVWTVKVHTTAIMIFIIMWSTTGAVVLLMVEHMR